MARKLPNLAEVQFWLDNDVATALNGFFYYSDFLHVDEVQDDEIAYYEERKAAGADAFTLWNLSKSISNNNHFVRDQVLQIHKVAIGLEGEHAVCTCGLITNMRSDGPIHEVAGHIESQTKTLTTKFFVPRRDQNTQVSTYELYCHTCREFTGDTLPRGDSEIEDPAAYKAVIDAHVCKAASELELLEYSGPLSVVLNKDDGQLHYHCEDCGDLGLVVLDELGEIDQDELEEMQAHHL